MDFALSPRAQDYLRRIRAFIKDRVLPVEVLHLRDIAERKVGGDWTQWTISPEFEALKADAKSQGLWNLFLPDEELGAGLNHVEYAALAEEMGKSFMGPEVFNCSAPDTGNMEVLYKYGSDEQKERWLKPLLAGEIRSAFGMT